MHTEDIRGMLDLMTQAAFCVKDNIIICANQAARARLIDEGNAVSDLLHTGKEEYAEFTQGCLYLTLLVGGERCGASVSRVQDADIFVLEQDADYAELHAMALAARELRNPLSSIMTIADNLFPLAEQDSNDELRHQMAQINRGLFQMLRTIGNMSDAARYVGETPTRQEVRDVAALVAEIFRKAGELICHGGLKLTYSGPGHSIYCPVDAEKLERAIYNILSNAMKFTPKGGSIDARMILQGGKLRLSIQDSGCGIPQQLRGSVHSRFLRQPGLEDGRFGIGLGMVLIRSTAAAHGGTVLIDHPTDCGTRITMTLDIRRKTGTNLSSGILRVDYAGERDHGLIELSDVLPSEIYS